jgi:sugar lactone lactonase YvrE
MRPLLHLLLLVVVQGAPQGRLLAYLPHNRTTHVLAYGFFYSNGVAVSKDESYVAVVETDQLRVLK